MDKWSKMGSSSEEDSEDIDSYEDDGINVEDPSVIDFVYRMLADAIKKNATDIHIEPYDAIGRVRFRVDGVLHDIMSPSLEEERAAIARLKYMANLDIADSYLPQEGVIPTKVGNEEIDFHIKTIPGTRGEKAILTRITKHSFELDMDKLGMEDEQLALFREAVARGRGVVILTGPTNSGKNTTIYSALAELNTPERSIATVEYLERDILPGVHHMVAHDEIGLNFASAMRIYMQSDVDVIYLREILDSETADLAVRSALHYGKLVMSTIHTNDAASAVTRLFNLEVEPYLISSGVIMIQSQRLLRKLCPECREVVEVKSETLMDAGLDKELAESAAVYKAAGCDRCFHTGYRGVVLAAETMPLTESLKDGILSGVSASDLKKIAVKEGMRTLRKSGLKKMCDGLTSFEEVLMNTPPDKEKP